MTKRMTISVMLIMSGLAAFLAAAYMGSVDAGSALTDYVLPLGILGGLVGIMTGYLIHSRLGCSDC